MSINRNDLKSEVRAYLDRISYDGPIDVSAFTLARLQESHLHTIPYENFDILSGIPLSLEIPDLINKIIVRHRGGYCFELNALFGWLLRELGFSVTDLVARFWRDEDQLPPKQRHHVLKVDVDGMFYLCDVGVGGIVPRQPIVLTELIEQRQGEECYRMERDSDYGWVLSEWHHEKWRWIYSFTEEVKLPKDFVMASFWCENAPQSIFKKEAMAAIRTTEGRYSLAGKQFRMFSAGAVETLIPSSDEEYNEALSTYFGIERDKQ